jgi:hypothetical protein
MAWQGDRASMPQIAAKAVLRLAGRNSALKAVGQRPHPDHALTGILDRLVPLSNVG